MSPELEEARRFLRIAGKDIRAFRAMSGNREVAFEIACFLAQQAVEKSLKAAMFIHHIPFRRTYDLEELTNLLVDQGIQPPLSSGEVGRLNPFAVAVRYDDEEIPTITLDEVRHIAETVYKWAESLVGAAKG